MIFSAHAAELPSPSLKSTIPPIIPKIKAIAIFRKNGTEQ
jgi:hypothetical protein